MVIIFTFAKPSQKGDKKLQQITVPLDSNKEV